MPLLGQPLDEAQNGSSNPGAKVLKRLKIKAQRKGNRYNGKKEDRKEARAELDWDNDGKSSSSGTQKDAHEHDDDTKNGGYLPESTEDILSLSRGSTDTIELPWIPPQVGEMRADGEGLFESSEESMHGGDEYGQSSGWFPQSSHSGFPFRGETPDGFRRDEFGRLRCHISPTSSAKGSYENLMHARMQREFGHEFDDDTEVGEEEEDDDDINLIINLRLELDPAFKGASGGARDRCSKERHIDASYWGDSMPGGFNALFGITTLAIGIVAGMTIKRFL